MRSRAWVLTLLMLAAAPGAGHAGGLKIPEVRTVTLDNGLQVLLVRQPTVPLVTLEMWIGAGARLDPDGKEGLAALTAGALRKGAGTRDAEAFSETVDFLGAGFGSGVDHDRTWLSLDLMARDLETGLELLADAVLRPAFDEGEVYKLASQMAEEVAQAKDNPRNVLGDFHRAHLYRAHPYGKPVDGTEESLPRLNAAEARGFHREHYGADRAVLAVCGDIDPRRVETAVGKAFGGMPAVGSAPRPEPPEAPGQSRVLLVDKSDTPQTWFMIGNLGPAQGVDDFPAAEVVRTIFGGRFTSWLNTRLRIETGLTYGARFGFDPGLVAGPAFISSFTATGTTREAIDGALEVLDRLHEEGIGAEDLASAKAYMKGQSPYDYETASDLAAALCELAFYGRDRAVLDRLFADIDAVDEAACRRAIDRYFGRDALVITAIGSGDEVREILGSYGPLAERENAAPGFR